MQRENKTYDEIAVGDTAEFRRVCTINDLLIFANASGNHNPQHLPDLSQEASLQGSAPNHPAPVSPSLWLGSLISAAIGNLLPGPGSLYQSQTFHFYGRAHAGDEVVIKVSVVEKCGDNLVRMHTQVFNANGEHCLVDGEAMVLAPAQKLQYEEYELPGLALQHYQQFDKILHRASTLPAMLTAVVAPEDPHSLGGALLAFEHNIIKPILVGQARLIEQTAQAIGKDIGSLNIVQADTHEQAAAAAVALIHSGDAQALMKGHLHTDIMLRAILSRQSGLRTARRLTHVYVLDMPGFAKPLFISDAAINISPDLATKMDITQNAIDLARALGVEQPKVGILSAVETVNAQIPSSVDAALLSKMAERGQIAGGIVDGPLAMDNAISLTAAATKGIDSPVAGKADILVVPDLDAGNMVAKELIYLASGKCAGIVLGASVPVILTSRADDEKSRLASCAVAALYQQWLREQSAQST